MIVNTDLDNLLADPKFDVEHFIHNVNLNISRPQIVHTLINDPYVLLSIAEGDDWQLLNKYPSEPATYLKFKELGFEVWTKKTGVSWNSWYGVIASDELALYYRKVTEKESHVFKGPNAAENARKAFRKLKMHRIDDNGNIPTNKDSVINAVRSKVMELLKPFVTTAYYDRPDSTKTRFRYQFGKHWSGDGKTLNFTVKAAGKKAMISYEIRTATKSADKWNNYHSYTYAYEKAKVEFLADKKTKVFKSVDAIANEIVAWLATQSSDLKAAMINKVMAV